MNRQQRVLRRRRQAERLAKILLTDPEDGLALLTGIMLRALAHGIFLGALAGVLIGWAVWG